MQRVILFLLLLLLPSAALADGIVIPETAYPATVTIPDQRALICFSNGIERLVIETRFTGTGTNFAWVVPFPNQPVVEPATTGVFPTLQYLFRPEIVTDAPQYFPWIAGLIWLGYVLLFVRATGRMTWLDIAFCLLVAMGMASLRGTHDSPIGTSIAYGMAAFIGVLLVLSLLRFWRADMRRIAVILLMLFIAFQLIPMLSYVSSPYAREPLLVQPVFLFFVWIDLIIILSLVIWKEAGRIVCAVLLLFLFLVVIAPVLSPMVTLSRSLGSASVDSSQSVSILQRKIVGVFDTTTIASSDASALQDWLTQNGYTVPANAGPVIADYVKAGWVFVAAKIRRDDASPDTLTPHPLSFTFKTDKPVYPMRLTGLADKTLSVDLYVFSNLRAAAPHFTTESCTQPAITHPSLAEWTAGLPVATKLSATLTAGDMRQDVWLDQSAFVPKQPGRMYGSEAAWTTALNRGAIFFAVGLTVVCTFRYLSGSREQNKPSPHPSPLPSHRFAPGPPLGAEREPQSDTAYNFGIGETRRVKIPALYRAVIIATVVIIGLSYLSLPRIGLTWVKGGRILRREQMEVLQMGLEEGVKEGSYRSLDEARADAQKIVGSTDYVRNWDNTLTGGQVREEDSPGNYVLQETNRQLQLVIFDADGRPDVADLGTLPFTLESSKN